MLHQNDDEEAMKTLSSSLAKIIRPFVHSRYATSKMLPTVCKSDVLLSPFHDALMLRRLLHWL